LPHVDLKLQDTKYISVNAGTMKLARKERTSLDRFVYEINISRTQMSRYEAGGNMLLSTFLRLLHGLDISAEEFFKELEKTSRQ